MNYDMMIERGENIMENITLNITADELEILLRGAKKHYKKLKICYAETNSQEREDQLMYYITKTKYMINDMSTKLEAIRAEQKMADDIANAVCAAVAEEIENNEE